MPSFITDDGAQLYFEVSGTECGNPPQILIHGWCANLRHWDHQVRYFADSHRILCMDRRGMGRSTTPGHGHSAEQHAADVAALAAHVGFTQAVIVAHAGGGPAGVFVCARHAALARAFVLIDSAIMPGLDLEQPASRAAQFYADMMVKLNAPDNDDYFRAMYASYFAPHADPALVASVVAEACRTAPAVRAAEINLMAADTATLAARLEQPTLVIVGQWLADNSAAAADPVRVKNHFKHLEFARAIGTGHFVQLEAPEQTNAFLRSFISRLP